MRIRMWGDTVGFADWDRRRQCAVFQYEPGFLKRGLEISPVVMPLSARAYRFDGLNRETFHGLPGLLSDSVPDNYGNELINAWLRGKGVPISGFTPLDRLCYIGSRGMGALEYEPAEGRDESADPVDVDLLSSLAADVVRMREDFSADLSEKGMRDLLSIGTSAGGARGKAVIALDDITGEVRSGQLDLPDHSYWIVKFDTEPEGTGRKGYCEIEYAYHLMARECGLDMTECRLLDTGRKKHFMTRRFDRVGGVRAHVQTLCALAHYDFRVPGRYSYEDAFRIMRRLGMPYPDLEQLFRRMAFNVIMENRDDHTKNLSFIMDRKGGWNISPAYDVTYAYDPDNYWISKHQMSVNGKTEGITKDDILAAAEDAGVRGAEDIVRRISSVAEDWRTYAEDAEVPRDSTERIVRAISKNARASRR